MRILLLGGTAEARELADRLQPETDVITSLAGRVPDPALPAGAVRIGGFGGVDGLREWLSANGIGAVLDATHPFAETMTANAASACAALGLPHLVLRRPAWDPNGADVVDSAPAAAELVARRRYQRVFLTTGRSGVPFFTDGDAWFLIRAVTPVDPAVLPQRHEVVLSRGPYRFDDERALLERHRIDAVVTKNSGGELTRAKLDAARALGVDVVMIARPALPPGLRVVDTAAQALAWVSSVAAGVLSRGSAEA